VSAAYPWQRRLSMIYTHVATRNKLGVHSPLDGP